MSRFYPVAGAERALYGVGAVAAAFGRGPDGVLLLEREPRWERPEPRSDFGQRLAPCLLTASLAYPGEKLGCAPSDRALALLEEGPPGDAAREHVRVRILRRHEPPRVDDEDGRALLCSSSLLDRAPRPGAPGIVVVETERDRLDAERSQPLEQLG